MSLDPMQSLLRNTFCQHATRFAVQGRSVSWTYAELDDSSHRLAQALLARGVQPGQTVPLLMARSPLLVLVQVALLRIGAGYSPIDMSSPAGRRQSMLDALASPLLLSDGSDATVQDSASTGVFDIAAWLHARGTSSVDVAAAATWRVPPADSPIYVMFTSGSTGAPKGVMVPHAGIVRLVEDGSCARFGPQQRWGFMSSPAFDLSTLEVWGALLNGGCCVVQEETLPSLDQMSEFLIKQRVTDTWLTSALFNAMVEDQLAALGGLQQLLVGGERVSPQHMRLMLLAHPQVSLINGYGPTENTTLTTWHSVDLKDTEAAPGVPIGRALFRTQVRIDVIDPDRADRGELLTAGDGVALGYLGDAELSARKFVWQDGVRWYRTGDLVSQRADGVYEFLGRVDRQIKLRGHRIELEEVEQVLTRCPGVGNGAVLVLGDIADERRIVAVYNLLDANGPSELDVAAHMRSILLAQAVPTEFVRMEQLPMNLNGKVDRKALEALWATGRFETGAAPEAPATSPTSLLERLQRAFQTRPEHAAVEGTHETLSYAELDRRSALLASRFAALGIRAGDHVALFLPRSPALVVAVVACARVGAVYAPIDLESPAQRIAQMLGVLRPRLILADAARDASLAEAGQAACPRLDPATLDWQAPCAPPAAPGSGPAVAVCVFFTSGSTGTPKAVTVAAAGIERLVRDAHHVRFGAQQRWAFLSSPAFDASTLEMWGPLLNGATCVVHEPGNPTLEALGQFLLQRRISDAWLTAGLFNALVQDQLPALGALSQLLVGGERLSPQHARRMLRAHPATRLINGYGPTENTTFTLCHTVTLADTDAPTGIPIGRPVPETQVRIEPTDPETAAEGELWASGAGVALGYFDDPEQTSRKFVFHAGARWYRTGDLVRQRLDGSFEFLGRVDRQVKLQGHRVELDEVEWALASCPGIAVAAVVLRGDEAANRHLAACFCSASGALPDIEIVARHLATLLPAAAMPKYFRPLQKLPLNLNGKVDRAALAQLLDADEHAPNLDHEAHAAAGAETFDRAESALAAIWQELLPQARLRRNSHFLRIGGTSLLALHVAALVRERLQRQIAPVDVLRYPVLADQAQLVALADAAPLQARRWGDSSTQPSADAQITLTRMQQNLLAATPLDPSGCAYLIHVALNVAALPDPQAWRGAFVALAQRHPALRLRAHHDGFAAHAELLDELPPGWWQQQPALAQAPTDLGWPAELLTLINRPLDTGKDGSMRVDHFPVDGGGALVVWTVHHYINDEASTDIALHDLDALLSQRTLQPVYGSPFAFPAIEAAWSDAKAVNSLAARIAQVLGGHKPALERSPAAGREARMEPAQPLQAPLDDFCRLQGCTPFPVLLTAYGLALQDVFGPAFRFVITPFSRRAEPELIEPIGLLLDLRVIEAGALPAESAVQTLARVANTAREAQQPSFQSFEDLIRAVAREDAQAAEGLTQFGLTWRIDPARSVEIAGQAVALIRPPQVGARFSMCLHVAQLGSSIGCSIEAIESAWVDGSVAKVWAAFERRLHLLCAEPHCAALDPGATAALAPLMQPAVPAPVHPLDEALRRVWLRWVTVANPAVVADSHFLRSGGSSLAAMRMVAELRRDHGVKLDVSSFLANPTFARLSALIQKPKAAPSDKYVLLGPADYAKVIMIIPGEGGQVAGMYAMAQELQERLPADIAVAIVDLDATLEAAPVEDPLWFVTRRIGQIVRDLGPTRVLKIIGFSLGGTIALRVSAELGGDAKVPVWLRDTFAPRSHRKGFWRRVESRLAWQIFGGRRFDDPKLPAVAFAAPPRFRSSIEKWAHLSAQLVQGQFLAPVTPVRLIQARTSAQHVGLLWQRRNNGFVPGDYASWEVHKIEGAHLDITKQLAASTAQLIVDLGHWGEAVAA